MSSDDKEPKPGCEGPPAHDRHLCRLMEMGLTAEIDRLTSEPNFTCKNCGAYAKAAETLCNPEAL